MDINARNLISHGEGRAASTTQLTSLLAPNHKLPEDVLLYIFRMCQWSDHKDGYIRVAGKKLPVAVVISHVCSNWRKIALSSSTLWSRISTESDDYKPNDKMAGILTETCITRSREAPLHFFLSGGSLPDSMLTESCIRAVSQSAHRWETFVSDDVRHVSWIMRNIPETAVFSLLKKLTFIQIDIPIRLNPTPVLTHLVLSETERILSLASAPLLSSFHVDFFDANMLLEARDFPWNQVTQFTSGLEVYYGKEDIHKVLQLMPNLVSLDLDASGILSNEGNTFLPNLLELAIGGSRPSAALNVLTTPKLTKLTLRTKTSQEDLLDYLARSGCTIEELTLLEPAIVPIPWEDQAMKGLKTISLYRLIGKTQDIDDDLLSKFDSRSVFPKLETVFIKIYFPGFDYDTAEKLINDIKSDLPNNSTNGIPSLREFVPSQAVQVQVHATAVTESEFERHGISSYYDSDEEDEEELWMFDAF